MIRKLNCNDIDEYINLAHNVSNNLEDKRFLIPISDEELKSIFNNSDTIIFGLFIDNKLVSSVQINNKNDKYVEMGGFLTNTNYRCKGYLKQICNYIIDNYNYKYIASVHPENIPSKKIIESIGGRFIEKTKINNYERLIYKIEK